MISNVTNDNTLQCPCLKVCYEMVDENGFGNFGAKGIVEGTNDRNYFDCTGCYIMNNNLIPKLVKIHNDQTKYPKGSMFHYFNTYGNAVGMYTEGVNKNNAK